jgi:hypothetical protein
MSTVFLNVYCHVDDHARPDQATVSTLWTERSCNFPDEACLEAPRAAIWVHTGRRRHSIKEKDQAGNAIWKITWFCYVIMLLDHVAVSCYLSSGARNIGYAKIHNVYEFSWAWKLFCHLPQINREHNNLLCAQQMHCVYHQELCSALIRQNKISPTSSKTLCE